MILKAYEISKINTNINKIILFYGQNQGAKEEGISRLIDDKKENIIKYDEKQIIENQDIFYENILSKSLFDENKIVIINRATDKIFKIIEDLNENKLDDILLIIEANNLDKKSKLRSFIEKSKSYICVPFYQDENSMLSKIFYNFLKENNLSISNENINLILSRCNGDRGILKNELNKIKFYSLKNKKLTTENILKLTNLIENHSISELIDNCLAKNRTKTISILNENNLNPDECVVITRTFLQKCKRLQKLALDYNHNKDLNKTIMNAKPPVFWKDKEIIKKQITKWKIEQINKLIFELNFIELQIKKNYNNSLNIIMNFILENVSEKG